MMRSTQHTPPRLLATSPPGRQGLKKRFATSGQSHIGVTKKVAEGTPVDSTTLSSHLAEHLKISHHPMTTGFTSDNVRAIIKVDVVWAGDVIRVMKTFKTQSCALCMKERFFIFKAKMKDNAKVLNQNLDIHRGCRHNPKFHRFVRDQDATVR